MVQKFKDKKKATIKQLQKLAGHLNFINRAVVPGRAFTKRMYAKFSGTNIVNSKGSPLKSYHHVKLDKEFRLDCQMWELFLLDLENVVRPFVDLDKTIQADQIGFYSDASKKLGVWGGLRQKMAIWKMGG